MASGGHGTGKATRKEGLEIAFDRAWEDAKSNGSEPGHYTAQIKVECENPIRGYTVTIEQIGGGGG